VYDGGNGGSGGGGGTGANHQRQGQQRRHLKRSGDGTVPYASLNRCHEWLGARVNITGAAR
jgi:hypothetical protein